MAKNALVTGGAKGIGAAIARSLGRNGWKVIVNYNRSHKAAEALAEEIGGTAVRADISDMEAVCGVFKDYGPFELLVNNAGVSGFGLLSETSEGEWARIFAVNVKGAYNCAKCAIPHMVREKSGVIINISSIWGIIGASCEAAYSASKSALIGLTLSLAKELGPSGIRVNCIAPGVIDTEMLNGFSAVEKDSLVLATPLGRLGLPEDVAELAAFLASEKASFITGQIIGVDGGFGR